MGEAISINAVRSIRYVPAGAPYIARVDGGYARAEAPVEGYEVHLADSVAFVPEEALQRAYREGRGTR